MTDLPPGLADWVRMPGPSALLAAVRIRAQRGHATESGTLSTLALSDAQRREIGLLLGTPWALSTKAVRLQDLARGLVEHGLTVRELVETVHGGPIEANRALRERAAALAADERARAAAMITATGVEQATAESWLGDPGLPRAGQGILADLAHDVATVWRVLPRGGHHTRLATLAAQTFDNAHALDADQAVGRAVARLAAVMHGLERPQRSGTTWREAWAAIGVQCDGVSSRVLTMNLPLSGSSAATRLCVAAYGDPVWLTLRSLEGEWTAPRDTTVFVCENPTIVEAAADALGDRCPPMVCTDGIASGAALDLLTGLSNAGCSIVARADIDPAGFTIIDQVRSVSGTLTLWRFDADTYARVLGSPRPEPLPSSTDLVLAQLRKAYGAEGIAVHEERIQDLLIEDLRQAVSATF